MTDAIADFLNPQMADSPTYSISVEFGSIVYEFPSKVWTLVRQTDWQPEEEVFEMNWDKTISIMLMTSKASAEHCSNELTKRGVHGTRPISFPSVQSLLDTLEFMASGMWNHVAFYSSGLGYSSVPIEKAIAELRMRSLLGN